MLIDSPRLDDDDRAAWKRTEEVDAVWSATAAFRARVALAQSEIFKFCGHPGGYAGVSWGKDSTVLADLVAGFGCRLPLVWVRVEPIANPDCATVRDAYRALRPEQQYDEITIACSSDEYGWHATGTLERGFAVAADRYGDRHVSGIRADESAGRKLRFLRHGHATERTCAPLSRWTPADVFAYLYWRELPVHPAYAMTQHGLWTRDRIRVASLGGRRGDGHGRAEWERRYYGDYLARMEAT